MMFAAWNELAQAWQAVADVHAEVLHAEATWPAWADVEACATTNESAILSADLAAHCGYQFVKQLQDPPMFGSSRALQVHCNRTNRLRTVLQIPRAQLQQLDSSQQQQLIACLEETSNLHHPHTLQVHEVFATPLHLNIVLEECSAGRLTDFASKQYSTWGPAGVQAAMSPDLARWYLQQVVLAVQYCHEMTEAHIGGAQLSIEETVLKVVPNVPQPIVKVPTLLLAHGLTALTQPAAVVSPSEQQAAAGSANSQHQVKADVYACGMLLLQLLGGQLSKQQPGGFELPSLAQDSPGLCELLSGMLQPVPEQRSSVSDVMADSWFKQQLPPAAANMTQRFMAKGRACSQLPEEIAAVVQLACTPAGTQQHLLQQQQQAQAEQQQEQQQSGASSAWFEVQQQVLQVQSCTLQRAADQLQDLLSSPVTQLAEAVSEASTDKLPQRIRHLAGCVAAAAAAAAQQMQLPTSRTQMLLLVLLLQQLCSDALFKAGELMCFLQDAGSSSSSCALHASAQELFSRLEFSAEGLQPSRCVGGGVTFEATCEGEPVQVVGLPHLFAPSRQEQGAQDTAAPQQPDLSLVSPAASPEAAQQLAATLQRLQATQQQQDCTAGSSSSSSPVLAPIHGVCLDPPLLVLPRPAGGTLQQWISTAAESISRTVSSSGSDFTATWVAAMPWPLLLQLLGDVAAGVSVLHQQQPTVVHGGVHAAAVHLLQQLPDLSTVQQQQQQAAPVPGRVCQLSLVSLLNQLAPISSCHPFLAAPETVLATGPATGPATAAADVYGLGVLMFQLVSGWLPQQYTPGIDEQIAAVCWCRDMMAQYGSTSPLAAQHQQQQAGISGAPWTPYGRHMLSSAALQLLPPGYVELMEQCLHRMPPARPCTTAVIAQLQKMAASRAESATAGPSSIPSDGSSAEQGNSEPAPGHPAGASTNMVTTAPEAVEGKEQPWQQLDTSSSPSTFPVYSSSDGCEPAGGPVSASRETVVVCRHEKDPPGPDPSILVQQQHHSCSHQPHTPSRIQWQWSETLAVGHTAHPVDRCPAARLVRWAHGLQRDFCKRVAARGWRQDATQLYIRIKDSCPCRKHVCAVRSVGPWFSIAALGVAFHGFAACMPPSVAGAASPGALGDATTFGAPPLLQSVCTLAQLATA